VHSGFHKRNTEIAKADILIAFSWSSKDYPTNGGTADTWKKSESSRKIHVNLCDLVRECRGVDPDRSLGNTSDNTKPTNVSMLNQHVNVEQSSRKRKRGNLLSDDDELHLESRKKSNPVSLVTFSV
jgi:hypothetical protein